MNRLSALDAEFLHMEDEASHMQLGGVCVFEDPPPSIEQLTALIASKLHRLPLYRRRVRTVPFELGRPVWVDDPHFAIGYHVRHTALPAPGDDSTLSTLMGRLMSQPLDRERPLWEAWLVEGLSGGRWAIVFKAHHCMVDGVAGVGLLGVLLDAEPETTITEPEPWEPSPQPAGVAMVLDAWGGLLGDAAGWARKAPNAVLHPLGAARGVTETLRGVSGFISNLSITPEMSIVGRIGPHRVWASGSVAMGDIRTIRAAFGGTINDVVLAAVSGGYRALLRERGDDVNTVVVRSAVPVSVRNEDGRGVADNRVSSLLVDLPVGIEDPVERLEFLTKRMAEVKASHMAEAGEVITSIGDLAPPMLVGAVTRLVVRAGQTFPQRVVNTVTTNVPGPQFPLYCLGREMTEYLPYVPIVQGIRVGTAILSYNARIAFGVTGDFDSVPEVGVLAAATVQTIDALRTRALTVSGAPKRRRVKRS